MKARLLLALAACLAAPSAFSADKPLITKTNATGFTSVEYTRHETCAVYLHQVVITQRFGYSEELGFTKSEVRPITLDSSIQRVIATAAQEELLKNDNLLCDGPSTTMQSFAGGEPIVLFATGGCGSPRLDRQGPAALMLKELVDQYCPVTHDFGRR